MAVRDKDVVAFVGGGGKTSAMFRLAQELTAQGKRVVTTTTTRIFTAQIKLAPQSLRIENDVLDLDEVRARLARNPHLLVVGATTGEGKALGVAASVVDALIAMDEVDAVLVEADGSRMRPFKAPAEHEPVIAASTTVLVPVVGIEIVGKPLDSEHVHRAELVADLLGKEIGTIVEAADVARVIGDAKGGLKNKTPPARVIPLINQAETSEQLALAQSIATELVKNDAIAAVAAGAVRNDESPITRVTSRVSAVILAAGGSTRMRGATKQLLPWNGTTMVRNAIRVAKQAQVAEIIVVTGNQHERIEREIGLMEGVRCAHNPEWASGRASSVRRGIDNQNPHSSAAIFINADQPFLTPVVINAIVEKFFETRAPIVVPLYGGKTGSPVLFARELFGELSALQGEQGGRDILQNHAQMLARVHIADERAAMDLNTPEDYAAALTGRKDMTAGDIVGHDAGE